MKLKEKFYKESIENTNIYPLKEYEKPRRPPQEVARKNRTKTLSSIPTIKSVSRNIKSNRCNL